MDELVVEPEVSSEASESGGVGHEASEDEVITLSASIEPDISIGSSAESASYEVSSAVEEPKTVQTAAEVVVVNAGGTYDYNELDNKPSIEKVTLVGDKELSDFGMGVVSNLQILSLFK